MRTQRARAPTDRAAPGRHQTGT